MSLRRKPFFVRMIPKGIPPFLGKVVVSALVGIFFLVFHLPTIPSALEGGADRSWILGLLLVVASLSGYYAAHTLWNLFDEMTFRLNGAHAFLARVEGILRDRNFLIVGVMFGVLNCFFGWVVFGLPESSLSGFARVTILGGYWLAGFVCGMAVWGIYGVLVVVSDFARALESPPATALGLDYGSPDRCGGMLFVGEAVIVFASVTLITGIMISIYILAEHWYNPADFLQWFKMFWIAWPYVATTVVVVGPMAELHAVLLRYKREQDKVLQNQLAEALDEIAEAGMDDARRKIWRAKFDHLTELRSCLFKMRTWPMGWRKGTLVAIPNMLLSVYTWVQFVYDSNG